MMLLLLVATINLSTATYPKTPSQAPFSDSIFLQRGTSTDDRPTVMPADPIAIRGRIVENDISTCRTRDAQTALELAALAQELLTTASSTNISGTGTSNISGTGTSGAGDSGSNDTSGAGDSGTNDTSGAGDSGTPSSQPTEERLQEMADRVSRLEDFLATFSRQATEWRSTVDEDSEHAHLRIDYFQDRFDDVENLLARSSREKAEEAKRAEKMAGELTQVKVGMDWLYRHASAAYATHDESEEDAADAPDLSDTPTVSEAALRLLKSNMLYESERRGDGEHDLRAAQIKSTKDFEELARLVSTSGLFHMRHFRAQASTKATLDRLSTTIGSLQTFQAEQTALSQKHGESIAKAQETGDKAQETAQNALTLAGAAMFNVKKSTETVTFIYDQVMALALAQTESELWSRKEHGLIYAAFGFGKRDSDAQHQTLKQELITKFNELKQENHNLTARQNALENNGERTAEETNNFLELANRANVKASALAAEWEQFSHALTFKMHAKLAAYGDAWTATAAELATAVTRIDESEDLNAKLAGYMEGNRDTIEELNGRHTDHVTAVASQLDTANLKFGEIDSITTQLQEGHAQLIEDGREHEQAWKDAQAASDKRAREAREAIITKHDAFAKQVHDAEEQAKNDNSVRDERVAAKFNSVRRDLNEVYGRIKSDVAAIEQKAEDKIKRGVLNLYEANRWREAKLLAIQNSFEKDMNNKINDLETKIDAKLNKRDMLAAAAGSLAVGTYAIYGLASILNDWVALNAAGLGGCCCCCTPTGLFYLTLLAPVTEVLVQLGIAIYTEDAFTSMTGDLIMSVF